MYLVDHYSIMEYCYVDIVYLSEHYNAAVILKLLLLFHSRNNCMHTLEDNSPKIME